MIRSCRLRWRFEFAGKPARRGMWSLPGDPAHGAWSINKDGLIAAMVEAEDIMTQKVATLAECDGHDFVNFEWLAAISVDFSVFDPKSPVKQVTGAGDIQGLTLVTRDLRLVCYINGEMHVQQRPAADKGIHLAGFGR